VIFGWRVPSQRWLSGGDARLRRGPATREEEGVLRTASTAPCAEVERGKWGGGGERLGLAWARG
jgi:hypothetical protein